MRKLPAELDNPIDNVMLWCCSDSLMERLYKAGVTPNMITTVGNIFRGLSLYFLFSQATGSKVLFVILYIFGYYFDCLDGHFARKYNMCTKFGDFYDHFSDIAFWLGILYYLLFYSTLPTSPYYYRAMTLLIAFLGLTFVHFGCQQQYIDGSGEFLDVCQTICGRKEWLYWSRYFGSGSLIVFTALFAYIF